jgi:DNA-binding response OmpR family regulator
LLDLTLRQLGRFDSLILMSGTDALDHLTRERFDLVLCDAMMPDMNGLTLCERARHLKTTHPVPPIVILSAATRDELGWNIGTEYAPFDWWRKPFRPKLLVGQINSLLNAR